MADIAEIGFAVDTGELKNAKASLEAMVPAASSAEKSADKLAGTFAKLDSTADKLSAAANGLVGAADKMAVALGRSAGASEKAATASNSLSYAATKVTVTYSAMTNQATAAAVSNSNVANSAEKVAAAIDNQNAAVSRAVAGLGNFDSHVALYRQRMSQVDADTKKVGQSIQFTAREGLNFSRQLADIGTTAALGMSPFLIAIQQGPQLFDILQEKAVASGMSIGAVFRAAGVAIWTALAPLLPLIAGVALAVGTVAAAFGLATREINKGNDDVTKGLGLTEKQLDRLKKKGTDTGVTMGDTFKAFFQVIGDRISWLLAGPLKMLSDAWTATLDFITEYGALAIKKLIGAMVGGVYAIKATWKLLPAAVGDALISTVNLTNRAIAGMINFVIDKINFVIDFANQAAKATGVDISIGTIAKVDAPQIANPYEGAMGKAGTAAADAFGEGMKAGEGAVDRFFDDVAKKARKNAVDRVRKAAGDPGKTRQAREKRDPFGEIVIGAQNDIAATKAKIDGINMTDDAALRLTNQQKLLNEAAAKHIKLTDAQRATLMGLADQLTDLQIKLKNLQGFKEISEGADKTLASLKAEHDMIGLYGEALARARYEAELFAQARDKKITLTPEQQKALQDKAAEMAAQDTMNAHDQFMEDFKRSSAEAVIAAKNERDALFMTTEQAAAFRIEQELLAQARAKNIELTPDEIAAIKASAAEQAALGEQIRKTKDAIDFAKGTIKGFFLDMFDGIRQGKSVWKSFADAVINAVNRIIDKLLDRMLDQALDNLFAHQSGGSGGSGGGILGAILGAFGGGAGSGGGSGGPTFDGSGFDYGKTLSFGFAKGAAFSNGIVDSPTLFRFAKGAAIGEMGEAGPEAVMPLARGPDGSLGVQVHGGKPGRSGPASVTVNNHYTLNGALMESDVIGIVRQGAERTTREVKRNLGGWIGQINRDGAIVD